MGRMVKPPWPQKRVSLVSVSRSLVVAPMSPTVSLSTCCLVFLSMMNSWFSCLHLTGTAVVEFVVGLYLARFHLLKKVICPKLGWYKVLKQKVWWARLLWVRRDSLHTLLSFRSEAGATLSMKPMSLPEPMSLRALRQNTGKRSWFNMPSLIPWRSSSSFRGALVEVQFHQFLVVFGGFFHQLLCSALARSSSLSGMASFFRLPPSGQTYSTSSSGRPQCIGHRPG